MELQITQEMFDLIDSALKSSLMTGISKVMIGIGGLVGTFWLLNFTLRSIQWVWMGMTEMFRDIFVEIFKVAVIAGLAFNIQWYWQTIVPFVTDAPTWMGSLLSGNDYNQTNQIDSIIANYATTLKKLYDGMNFSFKDLLVGDISISVQTVIFYILGGLPFLVVAAFIMIMLKANITLYLVIGPFMIIFALFNKTRQWFFEWVNVMAGFMLTQVMFSLCLTLQLTLINNLFFKDGGIQLTIANNIKMLVCFWVFTGLAGSIPIICAKIMGGVATNSPLSPGQVAKGMSSGAAGAYKAAGGLIGKVRNRIG